MTLDTKAPAAEAVATENGRQVYRRVDHGPIRSRESMQLAARCTDIADQVVPGYRVKIDPMSPPSCTGHTAKRWQAAWNGACIALGGDPDEYLW